jgi:putative ABC transport system substrate-binding protein
MRRREFIAVLGGAAAWPMTVYAQQAKPMPRVAVLLIGGPEDVEGQSFVNALKQGFAVLGWTHGANVRIDVRWADEVSKLSKVAKEIVDLHPDVIVRTSTPALKAVLQETHTIPIVFTAVTDPVGQGLVENYTHPGGNITGFTTLEPTVSGKWVEVLKEIAPETTRVALIFNPDTAPYYRLNMPYIESAGASLAVKTFEVPVRSRVEIEAALSELAQRPAGAVIAMSDAFVYLHHDWIISLAAHYHLPTVFPWPIAAKDGSLISYGVDLRDVNRRAASYVDRILKGERPGDMPVQAPTNCELVINLKTAKSLGLAVPPTLRRDRPSSSPLPFPTRWHASLGQSWPREDTIARLSLLQPPEEAWQWEREATAEQGNRIARVMMA